MWGTIVNILGYVSLALLAFNLSTYFGLQIYAGLFSTQNLKKKYDAKWALVTGASSGIGKSLAEKLASQGINVVLVAIQEPLLDQTFDSLQNDYPELEFRKIGVNLGKSGYLESIKEQTADIPISLVFNNAGYIVTGFFDKSPLAAQLCNLECNATAAVSISHHFVQKMQEDGLRGAIVFTSSAAAMMPGPFSVMYASSKAFMSQFAASLAAEVKSKGIDVCAVHPSPVASNFYDKAHKLDAMEFFKQFSVPPSALPDVIFASIGRSVLRDIGGVCIMFRLVTKFVDTNFLAMITAATAHTMADYKRYSSGRK